MKFCDICRTDQENLYELSLQFKKNKSSRHSAIKHVCKECNDELTHLVDNIDRIIIEKIKSLLEERKRSWIQSAYYRYFKSKGN